MIKWIKYKVASQNERFYKKVVVTFLARPWASDDWEQADGRAPRGNCLAISTHHSDRGVGTAPLRLGGETLVQ